MEDKIPQKNKSKSQELVNQIIPPELSEKDDLESSNYIDHTCDNTPGTSTLGKYMIKIPRFDYGTPE